MLKTYEDILQEGQVQWLADKPDIQLCRVFITVLEDHSILTTEINNSFKQDLLNLFGTEPDAQDIPRRQMEYL
jgi:hypothetical protein